MTDKVARAEMLIRRPVAEVFAAFVDPETITKFWLEATSGPLALGARVEWRFMVPGATETVTVTGFHPPHRIEFDWSDGISVVIRFQDQGIRATRVSVEVSGFGKSRDAFGKAMNATEGFSIVLCDLKTLLESGRSASLVRDKAQLIAEAMNKTGQ
jgi:uncharacterized protein YndB with AHSA1/START domain